jgi:hypothetical protein
MAGILDCLKPTRVFYENQNIKQTGGVTRRTKGRIFVGVFLAAEGSDTKSDAPE